MGDVNGYPYSEVHAAGATGKYGPTEKDTPVRSLYCRHEYGVDAAVGAGDVILFGKLSNCVIVGVVAKWTDLTDDGADQTLTLSADATAISAALDTDAAGNVWDVTGVGLAITDEVTIKGTVANQAINKAAGKFEARVLYIPTEGIA